MKGLLKIACLCGAMVLVSAFQVSASHIVGGEVTYKYLGNQGPAATPYQYRLTFSIYVEENPKYPGGVQPDILGGIYDAGTNKLLQRFNLLTNAKPIIPVIKPGCNVPDIQNVHITLNTYEITVNLPFATKGYQIIHERCCRNVVLNIENYNQTGNSFYAYVASPTLPNSSPVFTEVAVPFLCVTDTATIVNNAFDADGDRLVYSFESPFGGATSNNATPIAPDFFDFPPKMATYANGYSVKKPFGANSYITLDSLTGISRYYATQLGRYGVVVEVKEYRLINDSTEVLVGIIRRELQFVVGDCPGNTPPKFSAASLDTIQYSIESGEKLCFLVAASDTENDTLSLTASGDILDGTNGYTGPKATFSSARNKQKVSSQFCWQTNCATPPGNYEIRVKSTDTGCPPKITTVIYTIKVTPFKKKPRIRGSLVVCPNVTGVDYTAEGKPSYQYNWKVKGGIIRSGQNSQHIKVDWGSASINAEVALLVTSTSGCLSDSVKLPIKINTLLKPNLPEGIDTLCLANAQLIDYETIYTQGSVYNWGIKGGHIISGDLTAAIKVTWDTPGIGRLWLNESSTTQTDFCVGSSDTLQVLIYPSPNPNVPILGRSTVCAFEKNISYTLNGLPGSTYQWSIMGGTITKGQGSSTITVNWDKAGSYPLSVLETSIAGCTTSLIDTIIIIGAIPSTTFTSNHTNVCPQNLLGLTYQANGLPGSAYQWVITGGTIINGQGTALIAVDWAANGNRSLSLQETSKEGCPGAVVTIPIVFDPSTLAIKSVSGQATLAEDKQLSVRFGLASPSTYPGTLSISRRDLVIGTAWQVVKENIPKTDTIFTEGPLTTNTTVYEYRLNGKNSCGDNLQSIPHHSILLEGLANEKDESILLQWNNYSNWVSGVKQFEIWRQLDLSEKFVLYDVVPAINFDYSRKNALDGFRHCYKIRAVEKDGTHAFSWSNAICLEFKHELALYNVITPNSDEDNETWTVTNLELYPENELIVYNRWGREVYRKHNYHNEWNGDGLSNGAYYYTLAVQGNRYPDPTTPEQLPSAYNQLFRGIINILK
jgi:gliding motility-associated-like protein